MRRFILSFGLSFALSLAILLTVARPCSAVLADDAVVYGISPFYLARGYPISPLEAIRRRLPEISELGATILWIQPITPSAHPGHGYDVTDFFSVSPKIGTATELRALVKDAHRLGLRVLLDFPVNHTSADHPFAKDIERLGRKSRYYDLYEHEIDPKEEYASSEHSREIGRAKFVYYFWHELLNLNYRSPEARAYMTRVLEHWIREFDVDGYRLDTAWAVTARWPEFYQEISEDLRRIKSDVILLAEEKAGRHRPSQTRSCRTDGIDLAYDWQGAKNWISKWSFQPGNHVRETVFNESDPERAAHDFVNAVSYSASACHAVPLRYLENNDTASFNESHSPQQTRFAAEAMFSLPGVPLIFYGQEVGIEHAKWNLPAFDPAKKIRSVNPALWDFYHSLILLRKKRGPMERGTLDQLQIKKSSVFFNRTLGSQASNVELRFSDWTAFLDALPIANGLKSP